MRATLFQVLLVVALGTLLCIPFWACATDTDVNPGRFVVHETYGSTVSCSTATTDGSGCFEQDVEAEDDIDVGDDLTVGDDATFSDDVTIVGTVTFHNYLATETATYTVTCGTGTDDAGGILLDATDNAVITLPAVGTANTGCCITLINTGADGAAKIAFSPQSVDAIFGTVPNSAADSVANGTDAHAWSNTKATANKGDRCTICSDGSTGWFITGGVGVWANEIL